MEYMLSKRGWHFIYIFLPFPGRFLPLFPAGVFIAAGPIRKQSYLPALTKLPGSIIVQRVMLMMNRLILKIFWRECYE
jgi:hypothetical protein